MKFHSFAISNTFNIYLFDFLKEKKILNSIFPLNFFSFNRLLSNTIHLFVLGFFLFWMNLHLTKKKLILVFVMKII